VDTKRRSAGSTLLSTTAMSLVVEDRFMTASPDQGHGANWFQRTMNNLAAIGGSLQGRV
jgi:hypothetical protein